MFRRPKTEIILAAFIACGSVLNGSARAQSGSGFAPRTVLVNSGDCGEYPKALLDDLVITEGKDKSFILIARFGNGERSRKLVRTRLYAPSNYLVEGRGVPKDKVITAEGERVRGLGRAEIYVGGKLLLIFEFERNKHFVSDCRP